MKTKITLFFMLFLFLTTGIANAQQPYIPMIVPGNQWNEYGAHYSLPPQYRYKRTYITTIGKDTIIGGLSYYTLLTTKDSLSSIWNLNGCIREDIANRKVYYKPINNPEFLLYDFDVQLGDSMIIHDPQFTLELLIKVVKIDSILIKDQLHKRISFLTWYIGEEGPEGPPDTNIWIEGIGGTKDLLQKQTYMAHTGGSEVIKLLCFFHNENLVYKPENELYPDDCFVWVEPTNSGIENQPAGVSGYTIQQRGSTLSVSSERQANFDVEIINPTGRVLLRNTSSGNSLQMDISRLDTGVYIVRMYSENRIYSQKIIIK
jgi:hypothetical protein